MPATDATHFLLPKKAGLERRPGRICLNRRAFIELMDQKGWEVPATIMEQQEVRVPMVW